MSEKKTVADIIFGAKNSVERSAKKVIDKCDETITKTVNKTTKYTDKLQNSYEENVKKVQKQFDSGVKSAKQTSNNTLSKMSNVKDAFLTKLGFDKYKKEYKYGKIGENNFESPNVVDEKEKLINDLKEHLKLNPQTTPHQSAILEKFIRGEILSIYIKNTYKIAMIADNVLKTKEDIDLQLKKDTILSIEYDKLNKVNMFLNAEKETNCIEVGQLLGPEEKSPGIEEIIEKNSVPLEGEEIPKSPMEILQEMMAKMQAEQAKTEENKADNTSTQK